MNLEKRLYDRRVRAWQRNEVNKLERLLAERGRLHCLLARFRAGAGQEISHEDRELIALGHAKISKITRRISVCAYELGIDGLLPPAERVS